MNRRRMLLTGLSAASVASALPAFASRAKAQDLERIVESPIKPRAELLSQRGRQLEVALMVKAERQVTLQRGVYTIESANAHFPDGRIVAVGTEVPSARPPHEMMRRLPPQIPTITLAAQSEGELGRFVATLPSRDLPTMVAFVVSVQGYRHELAPMAIGGHHPLHAAFN